MSASATICPTSSFVTGNLASNPSFEKGVSGPVTYPPGPNPPPSAATGWVMHTDNFNAPVVSKRVPTTVPGPGGAWMLRFKAGGNEGGIIQQINAPLKVMFSAWVYVVSGQAQINVNGTGLGPAAYSTKYGEWEQLRVCSDGTVPVGLFEVLNQDPNGGVFFVDRVEVRGLP